MEVHDPFEEFAATYDLFPRDDAAARQFFETLRREYKLHSVLDCSCGTGGDLVVLHELGLEVFGSDISVAMLAVARQKLEQLDLSIPLVTADFRNLPAHFTKRFDAVLCMSTSLPSLLNETDLRTALTSMKRILSPGGIIVLTQGMTDQMQRRKPRFVPVLNSRDHTRIMAIDYLERIWKVNVLDCFHTETLCRFEKHAFTYLTLLEDDYIRLLSDVGFRNIKIYGTLTFEDYSREDSNQLIVIARNT